VRREAEVAMNITGVWHNQHHSVLHVIEENGKLRGTFRPGVGLGKGREYPVVGVAAGDGFAFSVAFAPDRSVTAWVGHVRRGELELELETLWHMAVRLRDPQAPNDGWKGIWSGADVFKRGEPGLMRREERLPSAPLDTTRLPEAL
jgi:hypothetical protein